MVHGSFHAFIWMLVEKGACCALMDGHQTLQTILFSITTVFCAPNDVQLILISISAFQNRQNQPVIRHATDKKTKLILIKIEQSTLFNQSAIKWRFRQSVFRRITWSEAKSNTWSIDFKSCHFSSKVRSNFYDAVLSVR